MTDRFPHRTPAPFDRVIARSIDRLRPSVLTEEGWRRRTHDDIPSLEDWQIRREIRIIAAYLDTPDGQRDWLRPWFEERLRRLRAEARRRREGGAG